MSAAARPPWCEHAQVAVLVLAWLAATAWARPLLLPDEGRYVGVAWEMMRSGDWLTPTLDGLPYFHKPPLFYWITAAAMSVFGVHEWAARAAPLLGGWLGAMAIYLFTLRWAGTHAAWLTLGVLLGLPLFYVGGQFANLDMLVAGCITATIALAAHAVLGAERGLSVRRPLAAAYALAALGVLAKGLIGAVIPALVLLAWLLALRRWHGLRTLLWLPGLVLFALIAVPWFVAMQLRFDGFFDYFFVEQQFRRYATQGFNNPQPFWFYPAVLALFALPWLPWLRRLFVRHHFSGTDHGPVRLLMLCWVLVVLLFFSLPRSKLLGYVLPALPPLAFLIAGCAPAMTQSVTRPARLWWASAIVSAALGVGAVAWIAAHPQRSTREIALALGAERGRQQPVFMLDTYPYDVPVYARLDAPVAVVGRWTGDGARARDDWRKELADAGRFAPVRAASVLIAPAALAPALCGAPVSWVIGPSTADGSHAYLAQARVVAAQRDMRLWRIELARPAMLSALGCAGMPNGDSAGR